MERAKIIKRLIDKKGMSQKGFAEKIDILYTTLHSMLQKNIGTASVDNVIRICKELGITVDELNRMAKQNEKEEVVILSSEEKKLIKDYRKLSEERKEKISGYIEVALSEINNKKGEGDEKAM